MTEVTALKVQLIDTQLQLLQANAIILQNQRAALLAQPASPPEKDEVMPDDFQTIYDCRDQMDAKQVAAYLQDGGFRAWLDANNLRW